MLPSRTLANSALSPRRFTSQTALADAGHDTRAILDWLCHALNPTYRLLHGAIADSLKNLGVEISAKERGHLLPHVI
jgi:hypothetical protein